MDYYFADTGEVRCPKKDEWYLSPSSSIKKATFDFEREGFPIYVRHEIERVEGATEISIIANNVPTRQDIVTSVEMGKFDLPRPKVRRWQFRFNGFKGVSVITEHHHTEEEMIAAHCSLECKTWEKIIETEVYE